jgi:DNA primase
MPLFWEELDDGIAPNDFTVINAPARLAQLSSDPWADYRSADRDGRETTSALTLSACSILCGSAPCRFEKQPVSSLPGR